MAGTTCCQHPVPEGPPLGRATRIAATGALQAAWSRAVLLAVLALLVPHGLAARDLAHGGVADMRVVPSMHARKALMAELADGFVALPGGMGTLDELFEIVTWGQLGIHRKPVGVLNVAGYYDPLAALLEHAVAQGFVSGEGRRLVLVDEDPERLLERMAAHEPPAVPAWVSPGEA